MAGALETKRRLAAAAYCNLLVAAVSTLPVVATGILAWRWQLDGARLNGNLLFHLVLGTISTLLIWLVYRLPLELFGVLSVAFTRHLDGFLRGVNG